MVFTFRLGHAGIVCRTCLHGSRPEGVEGVYRAVFNPLWWRFGDRSVLPGIVRAHVTVEPSDAYASFVQKLVYQCPEVYNLFTDVLALAGIRDLVG